VPAEYVERGEVPAFLGLEHEEGAGEDEAETADDLGRPVDSAEGKGVQLLVNLVEGEEESRGGRI